MKNHVPHQDEITGRTSMHTVMEKWPDTITLLLERKMHCVGCLLTRFHDVSDAAEEHDMDEDELLRDLRAVQRGPQNGGHD